MEVRLSDAGEGGFFRSGWNIAVSCFDCLFVSLRCPYRCALGIGVVSSDFSGFLSFFSGCVGLAGTGSSAWSYNMGRVRVEQIRAVADELFQSLNLPSKQLGRFKIRTRSPPLLLRVVIQRSPTPNTLKRERERERDL